jgi:hypothetical protein
MALKFIPRVRIYLDWDGRMDLCTATTPVAAEAFRFVSNCLDEGKAGFVTSELTIAEALVHAVRNGDHVIIGADGAFFSIKQWERGGC